MRTKKANKETVEQMLTLRKAGLNTTEIAKKIDCGKTTIEYAIGATSKPHAPLFEGPHTNIIASGLPKEEKERLLKEHGYGALTIKELLRVQAVQAPVQAPVVNAATLTDMFRPTKETIAVGGLTLELDYTSDTCLIATSEQDQIILSIEELKILEKTIEYVKGRMNHDV